MDDFCLAKALLMSLGCGAVRHSGRTLLDHLVGTYDVLKTWEAPDMLCLAGLFHSIYGTEGLRLDLPAKVTRDTIRDAIGPEAESLAWLFCMMKHGRFWCILRSHSEPVADEKRFVLINRCTNGELPCSGRDLKRLANLTLANAVDQATHLPQRYGTEKQKLLSALLPHVLPHARAAFRERFGLTPRLTFG